MAEDFYSQSEDSQEPDDSSTDKQESGESNTALVDNSFFGDKELTPGNQCKVEIVRVYDGETEIKYIAHDEEKDSKSSMSKADAVIDRMVAVEDA